MPVRRSFYLLAAALTVVSQSAHALDPKKVQLPSDCRFTWLGDTPSDFTLRNPQLVGRAGGKVISPYGVIRTPYDHPFFNHCDWEFKNGALIYANVQAFVPEADLQKHIPQWLDIVLAEYGTPDCITVNNVEEPKAELVWLAGDRKIRASCSRRPFLLNRKRVLKISVMMNMNEWLRDRRRITQPPMRQDQINALLSPLQQEVQRRTGVLLPVRLGISP